MSDQLLIARAGALGDVFALAPALAALRCARPRDRLIGWGRGAALEILRSAGLLDRVLDFEGSQGWRAFAQGIEIPPSIAGELAGVDSLLSFGFGALRPELLPLLRGAVLDRPPFPRESGLPVWRYLHAACARAFGPLPEPPEAPLAVLRSTSSSRLAWIQPGSGAREKNWPLEAFLALAHALEHSGLEVAFALGEAEGNELEAELRSRGARSVRAPLAEIARELFSARLWIGNDSGLTHLAALAGVPTLALFRASDERAWHPFGPRVRALGARGAPPDLEAARVAMDELIEATR